MHVGHLRSTIIGDSLVRVLRFAGHDVRIVSHIGDWGTPFGMLLEWLIEIGENAAAHELSIGDLDAFYKAARKRFDEDPEFKERARLRVGGAPAWRCRVAPAVAAAGRGVRADTSCAVNARLGVLLTESAVCGGELLQLPAGRCGGRADRHGLLRESEGAECVFPAGFTGRDGEPLPLIVRRSNGGFGYQATDLAADPLPIRGTARDSAALRRRHATAPAPGDGVRDRAGGWAGCATAYGRSTCRSARSLGENGKMLASRRGKSVKLIELLNEAIERATVLVAANNPELDAAAVEQIGATVGIGALKYADLSSDMIKDYVFDLDRMLAFNGDTSVYLQYAGRPSPEHHPEGTGRCVHEHPRRRASGTGARAGAARLRRGRRIRRGHVGDASAGRLPARARGRVDPLHSRRVRCSAPSRRPGTRGWPCSACPRG